MYTRDKIEEKTGLEAEIISLDKQILALRNEHKVKQQEITNAKISQSMRQSQIARLSGLSQPIELDQTYFFVDRHANKQSSPSSVAANDAPFPRPSSGMFKGSQMRTGEAVLLESRLQDISKLLDGHLNAFSSKVASVNTNGSSVLMLEGDISSSRSKLKTEATALVRNLDKKEHTLFATMFEVLNLRLRMIITQRKEVEMREALSHDRVAFQEQEAEVVADMEKQLVRLKKQFERDLTVQMQRYEKQLRSSTKKLENLESLNPQEAVDKKERVLREKLMIVKSRWVFVVHLLNCHMIVLILMHAYTYRYKQLKRRHALELEGYSNEAKSLRQNLQHILTLLKQRQQTRSCSTP
jgi:hypothetical protein